MSVWLNNVRASYRKWLALWGICKMKLIVEMIAYSSKTPQLFTFSFFWVSLRNTWIIQIVCSMFWLIVMSSIVPPPIHTPRGSAVLRVMLSWLPEMGRLFLRGDSFASGPVSVRKGPTAPQGWALSWTAVAAARVAPGRSESRATRGTSVTPTRACTATSQLTSPDMRSESVHVSDFHLFLKFLWRQNAFLLSFFKHLYDAKNLFTFYF